MFATNSAGDHRASLNITSFFVGGLHKYGTLSENTFLIRASMNDNFTDEFKKRVVAIDAKAKKLGVNFTVICQEIGVSRATPDRWRKRTPKTIEIVTKMEEFLARQEAEASASK